MTPGATGATAPPTTTRGPSAKSALNIRWDYPVYTPPEVKTEGTVAKSARRALSREDALAIIAGDDPRPLLVLRECKVCNGTDEALLKSGVENEKTYLLSSWFHCVKLPTDVMEEDHPFHAMFQQEQPEHLFVCSADGSNHDPLESQTSRTELWKSMGALLATEYEQSPDKAIKSIGKVFDKLDRADEEWNALQSKRDELLEEDGPGSKKLAKLAKKIAEIEDERSAMMEQIAEASALELKERDAAEAAERARRRAILQGEKDAAKKAEQEGEGEQPAPAPEPKQRR